ncbi:hypothetical protein E5K04_12320 [Crenobacter intestini]|uniref:Uncharacterized protein n=2 Tax=Crenobacter intestini TaxID=2563443 RepID=A0A4V4N7F0_9NEIS|nr:hypothetical protein E5K04_12320 [Crenobacter intestini]
MQYGFQKLVLLNSAGYSRAELPLDDAVSLIAPNNTGKTSLINALQFLLIIDQRRMDFGAHGVDKSRRFYFPHNSAYVLLEVSLPESGTVVLGCVGKGVSYGYEYAYFAYAGQLNIEEFRLPDGNLVAQPQLAAHLATFQRRVLSYSGKEFSDMLYGGRGRKPNGEQDFCVFRLEHATDATAFQRVLTRTLRLDKLRSSEVKDYLLQIFRRDLPDAGIDFKAEWDKAFADVNAEQAQYQAAVRLKPALDELELLQQARLELRGKLIVLKPRIEQALGQWQQHFENSQKSLQAKLNQFDEALQRLHDEDRLYVKQQVEYQNDLEVRKKETERQGELALRFALIPDRQTLEQRREELVTRRDALILRIGQAESQKPDAVRRELTRLERECAQVEQEIRTQGNNLYQQLARNLPVDHLQALNKVLAKPVLTLGEGEFSLDTALLSAALSESRTDTLLLHGLQLPLAALPEQYLQRTHAELAELQRELQQQQQALTQQLATAEALESVRRQKGGLEQELVQLDADLRDYDVLLELRQGETTRVQHMDELGTQLVRLETQLAQSNDRRKTLAGQQQALQQALQSLEQQHRQIERLRNQRVDQQEQFNWLDALPHIPCLAEPGFELDELAERLQVYLTDCRKLLEQDDKIRHLLSEVHSGGLTKYQFVVEGEGEISRLVEFSHHLPQEAEALEKKARSAVVNVSLCLRELRGGLESFKLRMREFNRKISGRQLSDLAVFKIEPEDETALVEAIDLLISTASTVETGESFELFNQQSVLDDVQLDRAKTLLIKEGNARQGLRVADLFRLRFWVGKADRDAEAFDDLDSAASNGTVLMAKLVTGLAMLHLMQDQRRPIRGVCYLDEALALDARNQRSLIDTAAEFGFSLIFASPAPLTTVRYCVPIHHRHGTNQISRQSWQVIEPLDAVHD